MPLHRACLSSIAFCMLLFGTRLVWMKTSEQPQIPNNEQLASITTPGSDGKFLVNTASCHIPDLDPFDKSVAKLYKKQGSINCSGKTSITYEDGTMLRINQTAVNSRFVNQSVFCQYQEIVRGSSNPERTYKYSGQIVKFRSEVRVNVDFIKVECFNDVKNKSIYINFHSFVTPKYNVEKRCDQNYKKHSEQYNPVETLNVLLIGIDSISRLNSIRHMPLTRKYLVEELGAIEMKGYTKVADNTFPCVVPLVSGKFVEDLPWNETMKQLPFDKYNFIWNNFSSSGYRTLYVEDSPAGQIFHYLMGGFRIAPADHYYRAITIARERTSSLWNNDHNCIEDKPEVSILLKHVRDFAWTYRNKPHFGFTFLTRLTHDEFNNAGMADELYLKFLQDMDKDGLLNNTVMLFYSDHGIRFGHIRDTYIGKIEERMPMSFLVFPKWFRIKYPKLMKNVNINSVRLTTLFDVHETLKDILHFTGKVPTYKAGQRGISLFREVPVNRTCAQAGILRHWCVCLQREHVSRNTTEIRASADVIVKYINDLLAHRRDNCSVLRVHKIRDALKMVANDNVLKFRSGGTNAVINRKVYYGKRIDAVVSFTVTVEVRPGGGMFEGTVLYEEGTRNYTLSGDLSRINRYGNQSYCIDTSKLKRFCFCK